MSDLCMGCMSASVSPGAVCACGFDENAERSPIALPLRTVLNDRFLVGRVLGSPGGFGITYLARDTVLDTRVAVKEFFPREWVTRHSDRISATPYSGADGNNFSWGLESFVEEARTLAKFDHAAVVRVRDFFKANGTAYILMDYYEGITLARYLERQGGKLPQALAVKIMMPILDGLREVHDKNFLHRDIKPQNIYLTREGRPVLLDFGAARFVIGERSRSLSVILTPGYAPHEQYYSRGKQGAWTDIYSCGAVLYKMISGKTPPEATERLAGDRLTPPEGATRPVADAIMAALDMEPGRRPQNAREFQNLLVSGGYIQAKPRPEPPDQPNPPVGQPAPPFDPPVVQALPLRGEVHPWLRFWARALDALLFSVFFAVSSALIVMGMFSIMPEDAHGFAYLGAMIATYLFAEAILLSSLGATPGKALLGIRIRKADGGKPEFGEAFSRSFRVYMRGLGFGIPIISFITQIVAYQQLTNEGITTWDRDGGFVVSRIPLGPVRKFLIFLLLIGLFFFVVWISSP